MKKTMKKSTLSIVLVVALVVVAFITCPDEKAHKQELATVMNSAVNAKIDQDDYGIVGSLVGGALSKYAVDFVIESRVHIENHWVYSVGRISWKGEDNVCSVGCFGHVFCPSKEKFLEAMNDY